MLRLSGLDNFYYLPMLHDMRYKGPCLSEIIRNTYHRDPLNGDIYIYMSRERFQTHFSHHKTYMWCLVNRKANIVIFFYEDMVDKYGNRKSSGRNRAVLKDFLGDAKLKSLQSDGYICYMYLDDDLIDIEHLFCLAHVRAKLERTTKTCFQ